MRPGLCWTRVIEAAPYNEALFLGAVGGALLKIKQGPTSWSSGENLGKPAVAECGGLGGDTCGSAKRRRVVST